MFRTRLYIIHIQIRSLRNVWTESTCVEQFWPLAWHCYRVRNFILGKETRKNNRNKSNLYKRVMQIVTELKRRKGIFQHALNFERGVTLNRSICRFNSTPTYRLAWRYRQEKNKRVHVARTKRARIVVVRRRGPLSVCKRRTRHDACLY